LEAETEGVAKEITGDMPCDTANKFVVCLQRIHKVKGSHTEHVFT